MDNKTSVTDVAPEAFVDCENIDLSTPARVDKRLGYAKYNATAISGGPIVNSLHRYAGNTEASLLAFCRDGTIRKSYAASGSFVDSLSGLTTTDVHASTVQFGGRRVASDNYAGRMFIVNGVDANRTYSEADGWQLMGLSAPATVPTLTLSAAGLGSAAMLPETTISR